MRGDGDGWVECSCGARHWGRHGAAGLLLLSPDGGHVLLQHRAEWSHHGGTWGVPGGARRSTESAVSAALRESAEEAGVDPAGVVVDAAVVEEHGPWSYSTVLAHAVQALRARPTDAESLDIRWVAVDDVVALPLHPSFAATWPSLLPLLGRRLTLVVDVANVMGSRPDGWWRDRAGAAGALLRRLAPLPEVGLAADGLAAPGAPAGLTRWFPDVVAVTEGAARSAEAQAAGGLRVVRASGSGDDAIVDVVREGAGRPYTVVTADRELRERVRGLGAQVVGPRTLLDRLPAEGPGPA